jgi:two-component sensor histidine kinase
MALTHEKLYGNDDFRYNLKEYIESLHIEIADTFNLKPSDIKIEVDNDIIIDMDMALPLGLIFNELITNSLKYGADDRNDVAINVHFRLINDNLLMSYSDSGKGIHNIQIFDNPNTMGLRLIKRLTHQLHGVVTYEDQSFEFNVPFKPQIQ